MAIIVTNPSSVPFTGAPTDAQDPAANPIDTGFTEELANAMQPAPAVSERGQDASQMDTDPSNEKSVDLQILPADVLLNAVGDANFALAAQGLKTDAESSSSADQPVDLTLTDANQAAEMAAAALAAQMAGAGANLAVAADTGVANSTEKAVESVGQAGPVATDVLLQNDAASLAGGTPELTPSIASVADNSSAPGATANTQTTVDTGSVVPSDLNNALVSVNDNRTASSQVLVANTDELSSSSQVNLQAVASTVIQQVTAPEAANSASIPNTGVATSTSDAQIATQAVQFNVQQTIVASSSSSDEGVKNLNPADATQAATLPGTASVAPQSALTPSEAGAASQSNATASELAQSAMSQNAVSASHITQVANSAVAPKAQPISVSDNLQTVVDTANVANTVLDAAPSDKPPVVQTTPSSIEESALKFDAKLGGEQGIDAITLKRNGAQQALDLQAQAALSAAQSEVVQPAARSFDEVSSTFVSSLVGGAQRPVTTVMDWVALKAQEVPRPVMPHEVRLDSGAVQVEIQRMVKQGGGHVVMELTPPDQSKFTIELKLDDKGGAYLRVEGVSDSTKTRLEQSAPQLQEQFQQMGLNLQLDMRQNQDSSSSQVFEGSSNDAGFDNQLPEAPAEAVRPAGASRARPNNGSQIYLYA
jgi:hypothetical protein